MRQVPPPPPPSAGGWQVSKVIHCQYGVAYIDPVTCQPSHRVFVCHPGITACP